MVATNNSPANMYIQSAELNGKPFSEFSISHAAVVAGGTLDTPHGPAAEPEVRRRRRPASASKSPSRCRSRAASPRRPRRPSTRIASVVDGANSDVRPALLHSTVLFHGAQVHCAPMGVLPAAPSRPRFFAFFRADYFNPHAGAGKLPAARGHFASGCVPLLRHLSSVGTTAMCHRQPLASSSIVMILAAAVAFALAVRNARSRASSRSIGRGDDGSPDAHSRAAFPGLPLQGQRRPHDRRKRSAGVSAAGPPAARRAEHRLHPDRRRRLRAVRHVRRPGADAGARQRRAQTACATRASTRRRSARRRARRCSPAATTTRPATA